MLKQSKFNKGQTLVEALIALTIILVIMSVTTVSVITSLNNANFVKLQTQSSKLAQQGMEHIRDEISNNSKFATYSTYTNAYGRCMGSDNVIQTGSWPASDNKCATQFLIEGKFSRIAKFTTTQCDTSGSTFTNGLRAIVTVYWRDGRCSGSTFCHSQEVTSCFINPSTIKTLPSSPTGI